MHDSIQKPKLYVKKKITEVPPKRNLFFFLCGRRSSLDTHAASSALSAKETNEHLSTKEGYQLLKLKLVPTITTPEATDLNKNFSNASPLLWSPLLDPPKDDLDKEAATGNGSGPSDCVSNALVQVR